MKCEEDGTKHWAELSMRLFWISKALYFAPGVRGITEGYGLESAAVRKTCCVDLGSGSPAKNTEDIPVSSE